MSEPLSHKFTWQPGEIVLAHCAYCKHMSKKGGNVCAAFPGRIPDAIRENEFDHRKSWIDPESGEPGDQGIALARSITFEPGPGTHPDALDSLYRALDEAAPNR